MFRLAVSVLAGCALAAGQTSAPTSYVHASRAALRAAPSTSAPILAYLTTNTELRINRRSGDWCDVVAAATQQQGSVACRLLSHAKLTIEEVERHVWNEEGNEDEQIDWAARAFWVSPSLRRLVHFAEQVDRYRGGETTQEEFDNRKPNRPPLAELNAMKTRLAEGLTAEPFDITDFRLVNAYSYGDVLEAAMKRVELPAVRSSHFDADGVPFVVPLRPFTLGEQELVLVDALSSMHRVPFRARVLRPVSMGNNGPVGSWDMGALGISFERPVRIEAITQTGYVTGADVTSMKVALDAYCGEPNLDIIEKPLNSRWKTATLGWVGKAPIGGRAGVTSRRHDGTGKFDKLVIDMIDLNADGVPDFSVWSGVNRSIHDKNVETYWKAVFGNLGGKWVLLRHAQEVECT